MVTLTRSSISAPGGVEAEFEVVECLGGLGAEVAVDQISVLIDRVLAADQDEAGAGGERPGPG